MLKHLLLITLSMLCIYAKAQPPCGFDIIKNKLLQTDPGYAARIKTDEIKIQQWLKTDAQNKSNNQAQRVAANVTYVPVVIHVMNTGDAIGTVYNPSDADLNGAITYLNQVYAGTAAGMEPPYGTSTIVNMNLQFVMAQRTPACATTNGIDRIDASAIPNYLANGVNFNNTTGCTDLQLKNFARWDSTRYYNIWVVNKIDGGNFTAGYAFLAAGAPPALDGIVILSTQIKSGIKTLSHEMGHAFNLYHPFQGSTDNTQCPANTDCTTQGDLVCDTDPISENYNASTSTFNNSCRTGVNSCTTNSAPYTINTESNFMNYTLCYTLFTNGQQARVNAAFSLPNRASLTTSNGGTPCGTDINFNVSSDYVTEANSTTNVPPDCRFYQDYTYFLTLGTAASATATATLNFTGTATQGLDYDVTTNGSFTAPSNQVTFASGTTTPQPFTVRIYDDANVESGETIIVNFTLNNGGGNATAGTFKPTLTIGIADNDTDPLKGTNTTSTIGTASGAIHTSPFNAAITMQKNQFIYKASELTAQGLTAGNITNLQLNIIAKASTGSFTNFTVKMANTTLNYLYNGGNTTTISGMTICTTIANLSTTLGWNNFALTTPFAWDGTSNLGIELCYEGTATGSSGADNINCYNENGAVVNQSNNYYQNNLNCEGTFSSGSGYSYGKKPIIQLTINVPAIVVETAAASSKTEFIGNNTNDYFYSSNNALLIKLSNVSADLGCVTALLTQGGNTWQPFSSGSRSGKVFKVTPITNGNTATYSNSLFFTNAELGGFVANTLKIAKTSATDIANANSTNTILVTPAVSTIGTNNIFTGSFTGFSQFFLVNNFVVLPLGLLDFSGKLTAEHNTQLNWVTSEEQNNKAFEIEMSRNGTDFVPLAIIPSKGNASIAQNYLYLHVKPQSGISYYRLKQTDFDGHFTFSKIIVIDIANNGSANISLYPVPAHNRITINFGNIISKQEIIVYSADMKAVLKQTISSLSVKADLDISLLPGGVYFIKISGGVTTDLLKFIKN